tara:strand:+ start:1228 stop:1458 length:231 start_codon:yes stop_codon:yes gene_type:complete
METRTVKFNLKTFIGDFVFLKESKDEENLRELMGSFDTFLKSCKDNVKQGVGKYLSNDKIAKQYIELQGFALTCML